MCAAAVAPPAHPLSSYPIPLALQVPYCSGDLHLGTQSETNVDGVRFAGHHIVGGILGTAAASLGLADATDVLFTGESAGGIGCVAHTVRAPLRRPGPPRAQSALLASRLN